MYNEYFFLKEIDFLDSFSIIKDNILLVKIKYIVNYILRMSYINHNQVIFIYIIRYHHT